MDDEVNRTNTRDHQLADGIEMISQVSRRINASLNLRETLDAIVGAAAELVPCTLAAIDLWDETRQVLVLQALRSPLEQPFTIGQSFPPGEGYTGWVVRNKKPLLVSDVEARKDIQPRLLPGERPFKAYIGLPLLAGGELIGDLQLVHDQAGAFNEDDLGLLEALAGQAAIAIKNARIYGELNRHHQEHAALSSVTTAINRHLELQDLLESALDSILTVTGADGGGIRLLDRKTGELKLAAHRGLSDTYIKEASSFPISREIVGAVARTGQASLCDDMWVDSRVSLEVRELLQEVGHRSLAQAPLVTKEQVVGTVEITARTPGFFNQDDLRLLVAIGQQLGIAIERAQLFDETRRQAHRLSVLNAVASVVNQPHPLQEIMDQAISKVVEVMETEAGGIRLIDEMTGKLPIVSSIGLSSEFIQEVSNRQVGEGIVGEVAQTGKPQVVKDVSRNLRVISQRALEKEGFNTFAVVPLRAKDAVVGTLGVVTKQRRDFTLEDMELLTAIGDQIGVAVENARLDLERSRLLDETQRRAKRLATLNAVAAVINLSLDLDSLLSNAIDQIIQVTSVDAAGIRLVDHENQILNMVISRGFSPKYLSIIKTFSLETNLAKRLIVEGQPILFDDMWEHSGMDQEAIREEGLRARAEIPLRSRQQIAGTLGVVSRTPAAFGSEDIDLLTAIGNQLGVAIENAQLYTDLAQRASQLEAVNLVAAAVNQPGDLKQILDEGLKQALVVTGIEMGSIGLRSFKDDTVTLISHHGLSDELIEIIKSREGPRRFDSWPDGLDVYFQEVDPEASNTPDYFKEKDIHLVAIVPLFAEGKHVGILRLATTRTEFQPEERALLLAIAHQLGTAIANAHLRQEALEAERLAVVGRIAAGVAHDLRSPLGGILRSAEFLSRSEISTDTRNKLSEAIASLARRLISTSQGILDYIQGEEISLRLNPTNLTDFLDEVLEVLQIDFSDRGIEVVRDYRFDGRVVMDTDRMAQVVYNLAENARDAMPHGGKFVIMTKTNSEGIELHFTDTGSGVPKELHERIFEPFFTYGKYKGAGLGLAIARQIVEEHGGCIQLKSTGDQGSTFIVSLPF